MKIVFHYFWKISRLIAITSTSLCLAALGSWQTHEEYWKGTIYRTQTVDFNLLSHTLPAKLSYVFLTRNEQELQRTLDSNYGLFGLVVTDCKLETSSCPNQSILFVSNSKQSWRQHLTAEVLGQSAFSTLRDQLPLYPEISFQDSRAEEWEQLPYQNHGNIIGRVYYVRSIPPAFLPSYTNWLKDFPFSLQSNHGAEKYYALTLCLFMTGGLGSFAFIEGIVERKRKEKNDLLLSNNHLKEQRDRDRERSRILGIQIKKLLEIQSEFEIKYQTVIQEQKVAGKIYHEQSQCLKKALQELEKLEAERIEYQERSNKLKVQIQSANRKLKDAETRIVEYDAIAQERDALKQAESFSRLKLLELQESIRFLQESQAQLEQEKSERQKLDSQLKQLRNQLEILQASLTEKNLALQLLEQENQAFAQLESQTAYLQDKLKHVELNLQKQQGEALKEAHQEKERLQTKIKDLQDQVMRQEQWKKSIAAEQKDARDLQARIESLERGLAVKDLIAADSKQKLEDQAIEIINLSNEKQQQESILNDFRVKLIDIENSLTEFGEVKHDYDLIFQELTELRSRESRLKDELEAKRHEASDTQQRIQNLEKETLELQAERDVFIQQANTLKREVDRHRAQASDLQGSLHQLEEQFRDSTTSQDSQLEGVVQENSRLYEKIASQELEHEELRERIREVQAREENAKIEIEQLLEELDTQEAEIERLNLRVHAPNYNVVSFSPSPPDHLDKNVASRYSVCLVGGREDCINHVKRRLSEDYGIHRVKVINKTMPMNYIRRKIQNIDVIVLVTGFVGHDLSEPVISIIQRDGLESKFIKLRKSCINATCITQHILKHLKVQKTVISAAIDSGGCPQISNN